MVDMRYVFVDMRSLMELFQNLATHVQSSTQFSYNINSSVNKVHHKLDMISQYMKQQEQVNKLQEMRLEKMQHEINEIRTRTGLPTNDAINESIHDQHILEENNVSERNIELRWQNIHKIISDMKEVEDIFLYWMKHDVDNVYEAYKNNQKEDGKLTQKMKNFYCRTRKIVLKFARFSQIQLRERPHFNNVSEVIAWENEVKEIGSEANLKCKEIFGKNMYSRRDIDRYRFPQPEHNLMDLDN